MRVLSLMLCMFLAVCWREPLQLAMLDVAPARLTDVEFMSLSRDLSEPEGSFGSRNLISNELDYPAVVRNLTRVPEGAVYCGVGPEQNFTYIAAARPSMAFIVDIRRGNLQLHLMYKALFELSVDRVDFVFRLFSRVRPTIDGSSLSASEIMDEVGRARKLSTSEYSRNRDALVFHLMKGGRFALNSRDIEEVVRIYSDFYSFGPEITYNSGVTTAAAPNYMSLLKATDRNGREASFLSSEKDFDFVKTLQARNLVVPVIGDFAGPTALRSIGDYVRQHQSIIATFYLSNVPEYLRPEQASRFCKNVFSMPLAPFGSFIESGRGTGGLRNSLSSMAKGPQICSRTVNVQPLFTPVAWYLASEVRKSTFSPEVR